MKRDLVKYIPGIILPTIFGVLAVKLYTNIYSYIDYQNYILFLGFYSYIQALSSSWVASSLIRYYDQYLNQNEGYHFRITLLIIGIISTVLNLFFIIVWLFIFDLETLYSANILLLIPFALISSQNEIKLNIIRVDRDIFFYNIVVIIRSILLPLIVTFFYYLSFNIDLIFASVVTQLVVYFVISLRRKNKVFFDFTWRFRFKDIANKIMVFGLPLAPTFLASNAIEIVEKIFINWNLQSGDLSIYFVAQTFSKNPIALITSGLAIATAPVVVSTFEKSGVFETKKILIELYTLFFLLTWPIFIIILLFKREIIELFSNSNYGVGADLMPLLALSSIFLGIQWISQRILLLFEKTYIVLLSFFISLVVFIILSYILISPFGLIGVAISNLCSSFITFLIVFLFSQKLLPINIDLNKILIVIFLFFLFALIHYFFFNYFDDSFTNKIIFFLCSISFNVYYIFLNRKKLKLF